MIYKLLSKTHLIQLAIGTEIKGIQCVRGEQCNMVIQRGFVSHPFITCLSSYVQEHD